MTEENAQPSLLLAVKRRWDAMWPISKIAADLGLTGENVTIMVRDQSPPVESERSA